MGVRTANRHWWAGIKVPRRSGEPPLRNSTKGPRNFGIWGALGCEIPCGWSTLGSQIKMTGRLFIKNTGFC